MQKFAIVFDLVERVAAQARVALQFDGNDTRGHFETQVATWKQVMAAAGDVLATRSKRWLAPLALGISGTGLVVATFFYSRGYAVS